MINIEQQLKKQLERWLKTHSLPADIFSDDRVIYLDYKNDYEQMLKDGVKKIMRVIKKNEKTKSISLEKRKVSHKR